MEKHLDRRTFIMGSTGFGMAVLAGDALTGCASETVAQQTESANEPAPTDTEDTARVFFTPEISPAGLMRVWDALGAQPSGRVAVKLSTGEPGSNYLQPSLIGDLVHAVNGTIVECNTAYGGSRDSADEHRRVAADHGFTALADVDIMDAEDEMTLPVTNGRHLDEDIVGSHFADYDSFVSLAHFKGHAMGGFGGAVKNCSIGIASSTGKLLIHSAGATSTSWTSAAQDDFLESMAEAAKAVADALDGRICYVNVMNRLSVDCDCDAHPADPDMADIGILASLDPVALDRACVDLVYAAPDGASLIERIESRNGAHTLDHAEAIGLGSQTYELVSIDG